MKRCYSATTATALSAYGNVIPSQTERSTAHPQDRYDTAVSICDPRTAEILKQLQAKMAEMEKIVGEVGGLVTQLAGKRTRRRRGRWRGREGVSDFAEVPRQAARKT